MNEAGWLTVIGIGPAGPDWLTPETQAVLAEATDLVGYGPYLDRVGTGHHQRHASDNREELDRARRALDLAAAGRRVAVVSGGDPGIFAMAAAVVEALDRADHKRWDTVDVTVTPGISALQAVSARAGAPLGNDFCAISLSDNLKPWDLIARRVRMAAEAGFVIAFYNPISRARPWQLGAALDVLRGVLPSNTPVIFGTAIGRAGQENLSIGTLAEADPLRADMRTLVIVGTQTTRIVRRPDRRDLAYTPRQIPPEAP